MKRLFPILLLTVFTVAGYGQAKLMAENTRSLEKAVKGAPFSAEALSESVQVLADGNKIIRRSTSRLYRDSEGRFRREDMPKQIGIPGAVVEMPETIVIFDPVLGHKFELNPKKNTARQSMFKWNFENKMKFDSEFKSKMEAKRVEREAKQVERQAKQAERRLKQSSRIDGESESDVDKQIVVTRKAAIAEAAAKAKKAAQAEVAVKKVEAEARSNKDTKTEPLGIQNMEGVEVEGTRTTTTIPAGEIGNERPIDVVYEKWYSKDLKVIVFSKHNDPRFGEQTYRLIHISRKEQPISLFSSPAGYTIEEKGPKPLTITTPKPAMFDQKPPAPPAPPKPKSN
jgi:hypothetical protein